MILSRLNGLAISRLLASFGAFSVLVVATAYAVSLILFEGPAIVSWSESEILLSPRALS